MTMTYESSQLFYILVAVLIVFLVVTLFSYIRTRRRRQIIEAEVSDDSSYSARTLDKPLSMSHAGTPAWLTCPGHARISYGKSPFSGSPARREEIF